ncbi:MAG: SMC family ATPase [Euryarchaeota archaeon]|nr:SMC family ATPase [Euryarchaeota archaeon]
MIIKVVELHNIRSHVDTRIELGYGTYLFEGDIGSGKTTILMGIEFALFGNSKPQFYKKLVRKGASEGYVKVVFEHDGEEYVIYRSLKVRGKSIQNDETYVITPNGRMDLSPGEVQSFFLGLLGISAGQGTRRSLPIVTYAIYTPQEAMKSILTGRPEERIEIIRKIFKLDEYRIASENAKLLMSQIRGEVRATAARGDELNNLNRELEELNKRKSEMNYRVCEVTETLKLSKEKLARAREEFEAMERRRKRYETLRRQLDALRAEIETMKRTVEARKKELQELELKKERTNKIQKEASQYETLRLKEEEIRKEIEELNELYRKKARLQGELKSAESDMRTLEEVKHQIMDKESILDNLQLKIKKSGDVEGALKLLRERYSEVTGELRALEYKLREKEREIKQYSTLSGSCPVCKRPLTDEHKARLIEKATEELKSLKRDYTAHLEKKRELERNKEELEKMAEEIKVLLLRFESTKSEINALKTQERKLLTRVKRVGAIKEQLVEIEKKLEPLEGLKSDYQALRARLKALEPLWREYSSLKAQIVAIDSVRSAILSIESEKRAKEVEAEKLMREIEKLNYSESTYNAVRDRFNALRVEVGKLRESLKNLTEQRASIEEDIENKIRRISDLKEKIELGKRLESMGNWLDGKFIPSLEKIEKLRLATINDEFRALFEKWFLELLGEGEYTATVLEDFSPVIRYEDYDMPIDTLSGGERTSVALAYRLALNTMVKRALGMRGNILILDEPTDGFSKDQLYKLKDILEKMETEQIIIVSHERELRNLADTIYRVEKENGVSSVRIV